MEEWTPNRLVGSAVALGLKILRDQYNLMGWPAWAPACSQALAEALKHVASEWAEVPEQDTWTMEGVQKFVERGLRLATESPQMVGVKAVVMAEEPIYGRRPDVVFRMEDGSLVVDDDKVALSLDAAWEPSRLSEYNHSWQLRDYAHHVAMHLGEPVTLARLHLIVLGPRKHVTLHPVHLTPETLSRWDVSLGLVSQAMYRVEYGYDEPVQNLTACTNTKTHFGKRCPMYDACHLLERDEGRMETLYVRKEKVRGV